MFTKNIKKLEKQNVWFFDKWAKSYDNFIFKWFMRKAQKDSINMITKKNFSAIDVSCGTGEGLLMLMERTKNKLAGIDLSPEMIKIAKQKIKDPKIELKQANVEKIPYKDNSFDVVLSTEAFHHYTQPEKSLKEMKRVLKKDGELIITDPDFLLFNKIFEWLEPGCFHIYNKKEMKKLFIQEEFKDIEQRRTAMFFFITKGVKK